MESFSTSILKSYLELYFSKMNVICLDIKHKSPVGGASEGKGYLEGVSPASGDLAPWGLGVGVRGLILPISANDVELQ